MTDTAELIAELRWFLQGEWPHREALQETVAKATDRLASLQEEVERLRGALRPFVADWDAAIRMKADIANWPAEAGLNVNVTPTQLNAARSALDKALLDRLAEEARAQRQPMEEMPKDGTVQPFWAGRSSPVSEGEG